MLKVFKVLLHFLYFAGVAAVELVVWQWLLPVLGSGVTIAIEVVLFLVLMMVYAAIFWNWRGEGIGDFFSDAADFDFFD